MTIAKPQQQTPVDTKQETYLSLQKMLFIAIEENGNINTYLATIKKEHPSINIEELINAKFYVAEEQKQFTPLSYAMTKGKSKIFEALWNRGANSCTISDNNVTKIYSISDYLEHKKKIQEI